MTSKDIIDYFDDTENRNIRPDLTFALTHVEGEKLAIDCGCGAGADIAYLRDNGFTVYAFDIEAESISRCRKRFKNDDSVLLSLDSFISYIYPKTSLVVADASLFFCQKANFDPVWQKIEDSLPPRGIFCGSFLGPDDTMASTANKREKFWPEVLVFNEEKLKANFQNFEILRFTEHKFDGITPSGVPHQWHIFSLVARKLQT